jgi:hypothetical protein
VAAGDDTGKGTSSGTVTSSNARGRGTGGGSPDSGGVMASAGRPFPGAATASGSVSECDAAEPAAQGFAEVVCALAQARAAAITSASLAALAKVDQPGSAALAADAALVRRLVERGLRLQGVGFVITGVRVVAQSPGSVTLTASVATRAHRQVRMDGSLVAG